MLSAACLCAHRAHTLASPHFQLHLLYSSRTRSCQLCRAQDYMQTSVFSPCHTRHRWETSLFNSYQLIFLNQSILWVIINDNKIIILSKLCFELISSKTSFCYCNINTFISTRQTDFLSIYSDP